MVEATKPSEFQWICGPGQHVVMGWTDVPLETKPLLPGSFVVLPESVAGAITVLKADVEADRVYDVMVAIKVGWPMPAAVFAPFNKGDPRRAKLGKIERSEAPISSGLQKTAEVAEYQSKQQVRVEAIKRDFLSGPKSDRVKVLQEDDCR
jgi:hypothetical protein